jgi:MtN3 and saliva related transmembrane protein
MGEQMKQIVAVIFGLGLICNALLFVPQAIAVWRKKTDEGISLITFGGFSVLQAIGIVHGFYQQDLSLILGMAASLLTCGTVTCLTFFYRMRRRQNMAMR